MRVRLCLIFALCAGAAAWAAGGAASETAKAREIIGRLPIRFEPNTGQWDSAVRFVARAGESRLMLSSQEAVLSAGGRSVRISLVDSNPAARIDGLDPLAGRTSYFVGNERNRWRTGVTGYARVRYADVYPGVDLIYYGNASRLEYDLALRPGADARQIRLKFRGADRLSLNVYGDLLLDADDSTLLQEKPLIYQETESGERRQVEGRYKLLGADLVGIELGAYDRSRPLTIDPVLVYSSLVGGSASDAVTAVKIDKSGNLWIAGYTSTGDLTPTDNAFQNATGGGTNIFLAEVNPQGDPTTSLAYLTYIGGSGTDIPNGMAIDAGGNIYLAGGTTSGDFPLGGYAFQTGLANSSGTDAFVIKFNPSLTGPDQMVYSTYLGGSDADVAYGVDADAAGMIYVIGTTRSQDFPLTGSAYANVIYGPQDAFIAKFDPTQTATLVYSTYLGGESDDEGRAIAVTASGTVYIAGSTESTGFPQAGNQYSSTLNGGEFLDGWIAQMDLTQSGEPSLVYSTYLGGTDLDEIRAIAIDPSGKLLVTGYTISTDFPVTPNACQLHLGGGSSGNADAFVARVDLTAPPSRFLDYSTYLGGSDGDVGYGITADKSGNIYVTGYTLSKDFPVSGSPVLASWQGGTEAFFATLNPAVAGPGALVYSSYLGTTGQHVGNGIAVAGDGTMYVGGYTNQQDIYISGNAFQPNYAGGISDGFVIVLGP